MTSEGKEISVSVSLQNGSRLMDATVWLPEGLRLSDIMNDERKFLPIKQRQGTKRVDTVLHKDFITHILEQPTNEDSD